MWNVARKSARDRLAVVVVVGGAVFIIVERKKVTVRALSHVRRIKKKAVDDEFSPVVAPAKNNLAGPAPIIQRYSLMIFKRILSSCSSVRILPLFLFFFIDKASILLLHAQMQNYKTVKMALR